MRAERTARIAATATAVAAVAAVVGTLGVLGVGASASAAPAGIGSGSCTSYAYASTDGTDPNGFQAPNETSYVAACLDSAGYDVAKTERGPSATITWQNPGTWSASARQAGFATGSTPAAGLLIELANGSSAAVRGLDGAPDTTLAGPALGVVVDVSGGLATFRVYDLDSHRIDEFQQEAAGGGSPTYIDLAGGHRVTAGAPVAPATSAAAKTTGAAPVTSSAAPTTTSATPTPTASPSSSSPLELSSSPGTSLAFPSATDSPSTVSASSTSDDSDRDQRYVVAAVTAVLLVVVLSLIGRTLVTRRRRH